MDDQFSHVLNLFNSLWFHRQILRPPPPPPPSSAAEKSLTPEPPIRRHRRSHSDDPNLMNPTFPDFKPPRLATILSGKEASPPPQPSSNEGELGVRYRRRRRRRSKAKSLTDLEFEELKGLMDLGFEFSEEESDPRILEIVPGLQRLAGGVTEEVEVRTPYLSEAWVDEEEEVLRNWRVPAMAEGVDLKDHLRFWARTVASTVR